MYGIDVFDSWLYDENKPFAYLQQLAIYDELKKLAKEGYFEIVDACLDGFLIHAVFHDILECAADDGQEFFFLIFIGVLGCKKIGRAHV